LFLSYVFCPPNAWESDLALSRSGYRVPLLLRKQFASRVWALAFASSNLVGVDSVFWGVRLFSSSSFVRAFCQSLHA
jgi:hypothetical protein